MLGPGWRIFLGTAVGAAVLLGAILLFVDAPIEGGKPALATAQASLRATAVAPTPAPGAASTAVKPPYRLVRCSIWIM